MWSYAEFLKSHGAAHVIGLAICCKPPLAKDELRLAVAAEAFRASTIPEHPPTDRKVKVSISVGVSEPFAMTAMLAKTGRERVPIYT